MFRLNWAKLMNSIDGVRHGKRWARLGLNQDFFIGMNGAVAGLILWTLGNKVCHLGKVAAIGLS